MLKKQISLMVFVVAILVVLARPVYPQDQNTAAPGQQKAIQAYEIESIDFLPPGDRIPREKFFGRVKRIEQKPLGRDDLAFDMFIPDDWNESPIFSDEGISTLNKHFLSDLGRYYSPAFGDVRAFVSVQAMAMSYDLFAEDWFRNQALINTYNVKATTSYSPDQFEALYIALEGDTAFAIRARVIMSGDSLFFVRFAVPVGLFNKIADYQALSLRTFQLINQQPSQIEKERRFAVLDAMSIYYPDSWSIKNPNFRDMSHLSVDLIRTSRDNLIYGEIKITAIAKNKKKPIKVPDEIQTFLAKLDRRDISIDTLIERKDVSLPAGFYGKTVEIYKAKVPNDMLDQELWFSYFESETHHFFFSLLTPSRDVSYEEWARNRAVYFMIMRRVERQK